jgi:hypothetical protein
MPPGLGRLRTQRKVFPEWNLRKRRRVAFCLWVQSCNGQDEKAAALLCENLQKLLWDMSLKRA